MIEEKEKEKLIKKIDREFQPYFSLIHPSNAKKSSELKEKIKLLVIKAQNKDELDALMSTLDKFKLIALNFEYNKPLNKINNRNALNIISQSLNQNVNLGVINWERLERKKLNKEMKKELALSKKYGFKPVFEDNHQPVLDSILEIYQMRLNQKKLVTSDFNSKSEVPQIQEMIDKYKDYFAARDIKRTPGKYSLFFDKDDVYYEMDKLISVVKYYGEMELLYYGQFWDYFYVICYVIGNGNFENSYYIFKELFPFYTFINDGRFWNTINFLTFYVDKIDVKYKQVANQFLLGNLHNPLPMNILANNLINVYLEKRGAKGKIIEKNRLIERLKNVFYFSDYTNVEVRNYIDKYGMLFLNVSLFLPYILYFNELIGKKILKEKKKVFPNKFYKATNIEDMKIVRAPYFIFEYLVELDEKYLIGSYRSIINKYIDAFKENTLRLEKTYNNSNKNYKNRDLDDKIIGTFTREVELEKGDVVVIGNVGEEKLESFSSNFGSVNFIPRFIEGGLVIDYIRSLFMRGIIGEKMSKIKEDINKDIIKSKINDTTHGRVYKFFYNFFRGFTKSKVIEIKNKIYDIIYKHNYLEPVTSYSQNFYRFFLMSFLFVKNNDQGIETGLKIFDQTYPFIAFFNESIIYDNISLLKFLSKNNNSYYQDYFFIMPPDNPLSIKIIQNNLIYQYEDPKFIKDKLKILYMYCDLSDPKVKEYFEKYGLVFLNFAIYLPELTFTRFMLRKAFDIQGVNLGSAIINFYLDLDKDEIEFVLQETIDIYLKDYHNFVMNQNYYSEGDIKKTIEIRNANNKYSSNQKEVINQLKNSLRAPGSSENMEKIYESINNSKKANINIGEINREIQKILSDPVVY